MSFSERLKQAMEFRNYRQIDLVNKTKIDRGTISNYLSGKYEPKRINAYLIAEALDINYPWLIGYDVPMETSESIEYSKPDEDGGFLTIEFKDLDPNFSEEEWSDYYKIVKEMPESMRLDVLKMLKLEISMYKARKKLNDLEKK